MIKSALDAGARSPEGDHLCDFEFRVCLSAWLSGGCLPDVAEIDLSRKEIAVVLNLTPQRVDQLVKEGFIEKAGRARYPLVASVNGYIEDA